MLRFLFHMYSGRSSLILNNCLFFLRKENEQTVIFVIHFCSTYHEGKQKSFCRGFVNVVL